MAFILTHQPCSECGSSDALSYNADGSSKCFSCGNMTPPDNSLIIVAPEKKEVSMDFLSAFEDGITASGNDRKITSDSMAKYGVVRDGNNVYFPYYDVDNNIVAAKVRGVKEKRFHTEGHWDKGLLFGQNLFSAGGKYVTITEGEYDAIAAFQAMGSKYACVSVRNGAEAALQSCKDNYEWLDSFETVVVCFDNDTPGRNAAKQVADLFGSKAKVFKHETGFKDACDYLVEGKSALFNQQWWRSEQHIPDGIVSGATLWDLVSSPPKTADCMYPWAGLNELTYGIRLGELVTVTAGSGLGKSQLLREILKHILDSTTDNIGAMFLEESIKRTGLSIMSLAANKPLHLPDTESTPEERKDAFDATLGTNRIFLFDHFGSTSVDNILNRVRYMAKGLSCKYIFLDHISIIVSAQETGDERKAIDEIMTKLRMLVQETNIALFVVSHLKRPEGKGHEEGASTSLAQLRGSGSIAQLSDMVIGAERNGQHENPIKRNTTKIRVLKNRYAGQTGPACSLLYTKDTGRMLEYDDSEEEEVL